MRTQIPPTAAPAEETQSPEAKTPPLTSQQPTWILASSVWREPPEADGEAGAFGRGYPYKPEE